MYKLIVYVIDENVNLTMIYRAVNFTFLIIVAMVQYILQVYLIVEFKLICDVSN